MRLTRLRIAGFKTFVEPTDVPIEPGLTGIVGPNGCGKSNLVEALRWVMGESSHKSMRATGMEDVIFAGSTRRPARNTAEVVLAIDNTARAAPAAFNDLDAIEVSRRIERDHGSSYHVNGREVRARDVQLLFADAATGARSPALVRQGQIGELISAKPQARRRILEDAAGIAGLHARRHEAEIRLRHAEENLARVEDVLREIGAQADALRRQGRQAARYRTLSAEIRKLEAGLSLAAYQAAEADRLSASEAARADLNAVADATAAQTEAARLQAVAAHDLMPLRQAEAAAASALARLNQARADLDAAERRGRERLAELERRAAELGRDLARQTEAERDAASTLARLKDEAGELDHVESNSAGERQRAASRLAECEVASRAAEEALAVLQSDMSDLTARRDAALRQQRAMAERSARLSAEETRLRAELVRLPAGGTASLEGLREAFRIAETRAGAADDLAMRAREALAAARDRDARLRAALQEAERAAARLETEVATLRKLFSAGSGRRWAAVLDALSVEPGYETALAASLGDDLDASTDPEAPVHWAETGGGASDPPLPVGAIPLSGVIGGPPALLRRLRQIGLVDSEAGPALARVLSPGQRLVTREGALWRWDGLTSAADAPSAAARRLTEKNRLGGLERSGAEARAEAERQRALSREAEAALKAAIRDEASALEGARSARRTVDEARAELSRAERTAGEAETRRRSLSEALSRLKGDLAAAQADAAEADREAAGSAAIEALQPRLLAARADAAERRAAALDARAALGALDHRLDASRRRRTVLAADIASWAERATRAAAAREELSARLAAATREAAELAAAPDEFVLRKRRLAAEIEAAGSRRAEAADRLAQGETALAAADRHAREALELLAAARERRAASEARAEAAERRRAELSASIADTFGLDPAGLAAVAGPSATEPGGSDARLASLKVERERLGGVNLRAEEELTETEGKRNRLAGERDDLVEAMKRLRQGIGALNREGRERLAAAFDTVNAQFGRLFQALFGGGTAELQLVDSEDPLEAGLEIIAKPPGKTPQSLTLLSGGEQALTATALIFAVFLTNPSPICVLDEVDAPLDDANVERYCDLVRQVAAETDTRFVVITHNPITMARMDRLFGVTMAERGVSQLVSVDLQAAEQLREAV